jgi:hypothetical protein
MFIKKGRGRRGNLGFPTRFPYKVSLQGWGVRGNLGFPHPFQEPDTFF